ncbi:MAG: Hsp20 family protein [Alphaproteobacteria bacterium]|nr:Hsp20 family protein [Alphaproteobacteria bacterium]
MTRYDFTPIFRSTIGFDRMARILDAADGWDTTVATTPPYNIEKTDENRYRITLAVPGLEEDELRVELRENTLVISATPEEEPSTPREYLYLGIDQSAFERSFQLADHMMVMGATLDHGLLRIELQCELPEEMRPRKIEISAGAPTSIVGRAKKLVGSARTAT